MEALRKEAVLEMSPLHHKFSPTYESHGVCKQVPKEDPHPLVCVTTRNRATNLFFWFISVTISFFSLLLLHMHYSLVIRNHSWKDLYLTSTGLHFSLQQGTPSVTSVALGTVTF